MIFSPITRIKSDFSGEGATLNFKRTPTLGTPVVTGSTFTEDYTYPHLTWGAISGATFYKIYRQDCSRTSGCGSWHYIDQTTDLEYFDGGINLTTPTSQYDYAVAYVVAPGNSTALGYQSSDIWFYP